MTCSRAWDFSGQFVNLLKYGSGFTVRRRGGKEECMAANDDNNS